MERKKKKKTKDTKEIMLSYGEAESEIAKENENPKSMSATMRLFFTDVIELRSRHLVASTLDIQSHFSFRFPPLFVDAIIYAFFSQDFHTKHFRFLVERVEKEQTHKPFCSRKRQLNGDGYWCRYHSEEICAHAQ